MNSFCEREAETVAALLSGSANAEVESHMQSCQVCLEISLVCKSLRETVDLPERRLNALPDAGLVWRKAQARSREKAIAGATRPILIVKFVSYAVALLFSLWLVAVGQSQLGFVSTYLGIATTYVERSWPILNEALILSSISTLVVIAFSSWYILREE
jgi:predicted anti-sigma-YlaC factor YlaD